MVLIEHSIADKVRICTHLCKLRLYADVLDHNTLFFSQHRVDDVSSVECSSRDGRHALQLEPTGRPHVVSTK